jgi:hypothetical protein
MFELARGYKERQMAAYTELQEREFAAERRGYSATRHQAFVGAGYFDQIAGICGGTSTQALKDSTESQQFNGKAARTNGHATRVTESLERPPTPPKASLVSAGNGRGGELPMETGSD